MPYYRLFYHFVWTTRDRLPLLTDENRDRVYAVIAAKVIETRGIVHALGGMPDHVHLLVTLPPAVSPAVLIGQVKGVSSHLAARLGVEEGLAFGWQAEYGVVSVSEAALARVVAYVQNQARHHAEDALVAALETC